LLLVFTYLPDSLPWTASSLEGSSSDHQSLSASPHISLLLKETRQARR